jgi:hypothetical protein
MVDDDLGPEGFSTRGIPSARRGYDKRVIDNLIAEAVERWGELKHRYDDLHDQVSLGGGLDNWTRDLNALGEEIGRILSSAAEAADGMRSRAQADADKLILESTEQAAETIEEAEEQAFIVRRDAWESGTELLELVREAVAEILYEAETEAGILRAEAEKDAHRRVAATRKEMDDLIRAARYELDRQVAAARDLASEMLSTVDGDEESPLQPAQTRDDRRRRLLSEIDRIRATHSIEEVAVLPAGSHDDVGVLFGELDPSQDDLSDALAAEVEELSNRVGEMPAPAAYSMPPSPVRTPSPAPVSTPAAAPPVDVGLGLGDDVGTLFESLRTTSDVAVDLDISDPPGLRDRLIQPAYELGVRDVKRRIVDLQNTALDGMRTGTVWTPDVERIMGVVAPALEASLQRASMAGSEAADVIAGAGRNRPGDSARARQYIESMAQDLATQLRGALMGKSAGEAAAAVTSVFRSWRTDGADPWVRAMANAAYHDELLAALSESGFTAVRGIAGGTLCAECPAGNGASWDPAAHPPAGTRLPPAHLDCACSVAPV